MQWSQGVLWPHRVRYAGDSNNSIFSGLDYDTFEYRVLPNLPTSDSVDPSRVTGRLGQVVEGGGQSSLFAIGNYINQRLLRPVHNWLMEVLARIPQDGTFDQTRPLDRLVGSSVSYSFDLKSATDRWPLVIL